MRDNLHNMLMIAMTHAGDGGENYTVSLYDNAMEFAVSDSRITMTMIADFDNKHGDAHRYSMNAWTKDRVYFTTDYDGVVGVKWVSRKPCAVASPHNGHKRTL